MEFKLVSKDILELSGQALVVGVYETDELGIFAKKIDDNMNALLSDFLKDIHFKAKEAQCVFMPGHKGIKFKDVIIVGLGKKEELKVDIIRKAAKAAIDKAKEIFHNEIYFEPLGYEILGEKSIEALVDGVVIGDYKFKKYKKDKEDNTTEISNINIVSDETALESVINRAYIISQAANFTRDIVNEPGNVITPKKLVDIAQEISKDYGLKCKVFDHPILLDRQMSGILAVGSGSENPPFFIHLTYKPQNPKKRIVIIGKGVTFDSGGLDIKPPKSMKTMKCDKAGACVVLGILKAVSQLKLDIEIHGLIPTVENMPSGKSFRPDDILVFKNGKSVEILNTDAEGRLILADALIYGSELNPDIMIDIATLTGASMVALGRFCSAIFTQNHNLSHTITKLGSETGEKFWPLPLDKDLEEEIKGEFSDIKNVGSSYGGAITAALFLKEFVGENIKDWIHLDIAGPTFLEKPWKYYSEGATATPLRTILNWLTTL